MRGLVLLLTVVAGELPDRVVQRAAAFHAPLPGAARSPGRARVVATEPKVTVNVRPPASAGADAEKPKVTVRPPAQANGAEEPKVTVRVRAPEPAAEKKDDEPTVKIRVRSPEEASASRAAAPTTSADNTKVTVKVKAPVKKEVPSYADTLDEQTAKLQEGVRMADLKMMLEALQAGADPNVMDEKGRPPLHYAAGLGLAPSVVLLVHFGAALDARDPDGLTPLILASGYAKPQTLRVLIAAGADPSLSAGGQGTASDVIEKAGDAEIVKLREEMNPMKRKPSERLQALKQCMDVLLEPEEVRAETDWDALVTEVLQLVPKELPEGTFKEDEPEKEGP